MKPECPSSSLSSIPSPSLRRKRTFRIFQKPDAVTVARPLLTAAATVRLNYGYVRVNSAQRGQIHFVFTGA